MEIARTKEKRGLRKVGTFVLGGETNCGPLAIFKDDLWFGSVLDRQESRSPGSIARARAIEKEGRTAGRRKGRQATSSVLIVLRFLFQSAATRS